ncbi:HAD family phosphatase [Cetobacterium sp. 2A]|uniref:Cof-type HAD-IIB family hydrolase n=1 Tax=Cetobacterium sp. 2A TaxID=2754723 RepID=UPI00163CCFD1|nr:Cof-type HAD-IIB family hydrolase [Cetobacterium sp. 2A]MBC2855505.1 HAD family phosphatase [Cetobacterium sp. 2A]
MKYKMIVTDLDDTLLNEKGEISLRDKEAIMKAQKMGVKFVLASGRPTFAMKHLAEELELSKYGSFILSYNGAIITECSTGKEFLKESLTKDEIHELHNFSKEHKVHIITYLDDSIISETESEYIDVEKNLTGMPHKKVPSFKEYVNREAVKCIMLEEPKYLKLVEEKLKNKFGDRYSIAISKPFFLEVTKLGIDKGNSLIKLIKHLNISADEVIVAGDSYNDISMLKVAGLSVAVSNAKPEIKEMVDFITSSNVDGGMETIINKYIF